MALTVTDDAGVGSPGAIGHEAVSGLRLVVRSARGAVAVPLSRAACTALAAVVLAGDRDPGDGAAVLLPAAANDPGLALWLAAREPLRSVADVVAALAMDLRGADCAGAESGAEGLAHAGGVGDVGPGGPADGAWFALAASCRPGGTAPPETAREWARRLRARIDGGALESLPAAAAEKASLEALVLSRALALATAHRRVSGGMAAEIEAARIEGLRSLAYGAGHEINNPLANIAARGQALLAEETDPRRRRRLATIVEQAFRARDMIGGLMLCARPPQPESVPCDIAAIVGTVLGGVAARAEERGVRCSVVAGSAVAAWADRGLLEEALRAVVVNALEALSDGGRLTVRIDGATGCDDVPVGIVVDDDGPGMDAATRRAALDPFYSGREAGRGIGFGLAKAYRFVAACGGRLRIDAAPGAGTRVTILLREAVPAVSLPAGSAQLPPSGAVRVPCLGDRPESPRLPPRV